MVNVGSTDKKLRIVGGLALLGLSFVALGGVGTSLGIIAIVVGAVLIVTGLINFCPAYKLLGIGTAKKSETGV